MAHTTSGKWLTLIGLAGLSGMRSLAGPAAASRLLTARRPGESPAAPAAPLNDPLVADALTLLAAGELVADKLPFVPNRTNLGPLLGRSLCGGLVGAALAVDQGLDRRLGSAAGAAAAGANTFASYSLRRALVRRTRLPDFVVALAEDALVLGAALLLQQVRLS